MNQRRLVNSKQRKSLLINVATVVSGTLQELRRNDFNIVEVETNKTFEYDYKNKRSVLL